MNQHRLHLHDETGSGQRRLALPPLRMWLGTFLVIALLANLGAQWLVVIPEQRKLADDLRDAAGAVKSERGRDDSARTAEIRRLETLDAMRRRQVVNEAVLLAEQERNLKLARELQDRLRALKGE